MLTHSNAPEGDSSVLNIEVYNLRVSKQTSGEGEATDE